jgi:toxin YoeB
MKVLWSANAWQDYLHWQQADPKMLASVNTLLEDISRSPFKGLGKPEPLKHSLQGWWSRRISGEHRLVYRIVGSGDDQRIEVVQCRYHY